MLLHFIFHAPRDFLKIAQNILIKIFLQKFLQLFQNFNFSLVFLTFSILLSYLRIIHHHNFSSSSYKRGLHNLLFDYFLKNKLPRI